MFLVAVTLLRILESSSSSNPTQQLFVQSEGRRVNSCPDQSEITSLLQMALMLESEGELEFDDVAQLSSQSVTDAKQTLDSPKSPPLQSSLPYKTMHVSQSEEPGVLNSETNRSDTIHRSFPDPSVDATLLPLDLILSLSALYQTSQKSNTMQSIHDPAANRRHPPPLSEQTHTLPQRDFPAHSVVGCHQMPSSLSSQNSIRMDRVSKIPSQRLVDAQQVSNSSKSPSLSKPTHHPPPLGEAAQRLSACVYPGILGGGRVICPLSMQQQLRAIQELPESARNDFEEYPSRWALFMMQFGRWMTRRDFRRIGPWGNEFEFSISGFDAAKSWLLKVHLEWTTKKNNKPNPRGRHGKKWIWRQTGWIRFILRFQDKWDHDGDFLNDKILIKWRIDRGESAPDDWEILVRGQIAEDGLVRSFNFCISKSVPPTFSVLGVPGTNKNYFACPKNATKGQILDTGNFVRATSGGEWTSRDCWEHLSQSYS